MAQEVNAPVFVDELPTVKRGSRSSGVWKERLDPLLENQGKWAQVYGPTNNPHAVINNVRQGNAAGVDADLFSFAGRIEGETTETEVDEETGEEVEKTVKLGYVYARYDTDEQRAKREQKQAERAANREANAA